MVIVTMSRNVKALPGSNKFCAKLSCVQGYCLFLSFGLLDSAERLLSIHVHQGYVPGGVDRPLVKMVKFSAQSHALTLVLRLQKQCYTNLPK
jgi:hypothetical protein